MTSTLSIAGCAAAIAAARGARDEAMARSEHTTQAEADKPLIDAAIEAFARTRRPFSANDLRAHLPAQINQSLIGNRFMNAAKAGLIRRVGLTTSTKRSTHAKTVGCWIGAPK